MESSLEILRKFIKLEVDRGYDNRAVYGGLQNLIPKWRQENLLSSLDESVSSNLDMQLSNYDQVSIEQRAVIIQQIIETLNTIAPVTVSESVTASQPGTQRPHGSGSKIAPPIHTERRDQNRKPTFHPTSSKSQVGLEAPITILPGIGPNIAKMFSKLGISTVEDLMLHYPRRYDDYSQLKPINRLVYGEEVTIIAVIQSVTSRPIHNGKMTLTEAVVFDGTGTLRINWFNPYVAKKLSRGLQIVASGKIDMYLGRLTMKNPDWETIDQEHLHTNRIVPIYPLTAGITQQHLRKLIFGIVPHWAPRIGDYLPKRILDQAGLIDLSQAYKQIHFPDSQEKLRAARSRLAFDEIFLLQIGALGQKKVWQSYSAQIFDAPQEYLGRIVENLPFQLTNAQLRVFEEIRSDLKSGKPMNRLLQGDVGAGKTIIAALAIAIVIRQGAQTAIMAPTSILAEQHYRSLSNLLTQPDQDGNSVIKPDEICLLVGDTSSAEKELVRQRLANGEIKIIIGTHALLESPVEFQQLQLAIIDEQHRFGVEQRAELRSKGENPHLMVMTATPIPRSLALTVYGDLDLSVMDELPQGRLPVETHVLHPLERERAYQLVRSQVDQGHQAFFIYPYVEGSEEEERKAAVDEQVRLHKEVFPNLEIGLLHGRMRPAEKDEVMALFRDGKYQILVSTSVVEVGVDIPNATVMVIEGANRFGLAQLHQFRGRVGRSPDKSYCLLIPETENALDNQRLAAMVETNDGFVLAERDLEQRGPGDFLGTRQSGLAELKLANITDIHLIEKARNLAKQVFDEDPDLTGSEYAELAKKVRRFWHTKGDIS
jgi:ATP-dependent DNA helicase RecG